MNNPLEDIKLNSLNMTTPQPAWIEKRITLLQLAHWDSVYASYFSDMVFSNKQSNLCGLPERKETTVEIDFRTGDRIIRYVKV